MYVHTGTVHVVQERMTILPYMCVPYTGVWYDGVGGVQVARIKKNGTGTTAVFTTKMARPNYTIGYPVLDE